MKAFIASLLFLALLGIRVPASFAQQDQSYQKLAQEMEALKEQVSTLQSQLQTVENTEKMKLSAELADAQARLTDAKAKLMNAEFEKFERELRDSNDGWLMKWNGFFIGVLAVIGVALWVSVKSLIADRVEKSLSGFKEALAQVDTLKNEFNEVVNKIRVLNKEHAAKVIESFMHYPLNDEDSYPEQVKKLSEEVLLDVLGDEIQDLYTRIRTLEILTRRESTRLISPALEFLNSTFNSYQGEKLSVNRASHLSTIVDFLRWTPTQETYEGLTKFLNRLLREPIELKDMLLTATIPSIAWVSRELNKEDWLSLLKTSISHLDNEPDTIKGILQRRLPDDMPSVDNLEEYLLDLLEKHDTEFVNDWRERKANANTETEATS